MRIAALVVRIMDGTRQFITQGCKQGFEFDGLSGIQETVLKPDVREGTRKDVGMLQRQDVARWLELASGA